MNGATAATPAAPGPAMPAALELLKPITWFAPMWAFGCGVVSSGQPLGRHWGVIVLGVLLSGPLVCGTSQAANDWFDRAGRCDQRARPADPIGTAAGSHRVVYRAGLDRAVGAGRGRAGAVRVSPPA